MTSIIASTAPPTELPFAGKNVPHLLIEVNQKCNISCRACYKDKSNYTKDLQQIFQEVEIALSQRNVATITLAGGEPTLHPNLIEIIQFIRSKNIQVQMLSNGFQLSDELLSKCKQAGLKEIYIHVDTGQKRSDAKNITTEKNLNELRAKIAKRITEHGLVCSMVITLYRKTLAELPHVVEFALNSPYITRFLITCYTHFVQFKNQKQEVVVFGRTYKLQEATTESSDELSQESVTLAEVNTELEKHFSMKPFGYISSNLSHQAERWHMYYSFTINTPTRSSYLFLEPAFGQYVARKINKSIEKGERLTFGKVLSEKQCILFVSAYAFSTGSLTTIFRSLIFLSRLILPKSHILYKDITVQQGPKFAEDGQLEYCRDCPDATIRNGHLVPVCLADVLVT